MYTKEEIAKIDSDTRVATDMKGLITKPIYNGEHIYRV
ncbi:hypothetical protein wTpre_1037 [Wolbachia endosymbiont of Trichogramma pretiosum]|nr:hypothetical protein wTpre_1037 [Wolbachia endosymbiont of Trichogramma pretiosum]